MEEGTFVALVNVTHHSKPNSYEQQKCISYCSIVPFVIVGAYGI